MENFISSCRRDKITRLTAVYILLCLVKTKLSSKDTLGARIYEPRVGNLVPVIGKKTSAEFVKFLVQEARASLEIRAVTKTGDLAKF